MLIEVTARHRIVSDARQWVIESKSLGKEGRGGQWKPQTYHPTLSQAGSFLIEQLWRETPEASRDAIPQEIRRLALLVRLALAERHIPDHLSSAKLPE